MIALEKLFNEFQGKTSIQRDEHLKKLLGVDVEIVGQLLGIEAENILLWPGAPDLPPETQLQIRHEGEQLRQQLLKYAGDEGVRLTVRFSGVHFGFGLTSYIFDLVSIAVLNTRESREREADERDRKNFFQKHCFIATAAYGLTSPTVCLLQEYRDRVLNRGRVGRAAVRFYYLTSPPLARFIEASPGRRLVARLILSPLVSIVRRQLGYSRRISARMSPSSLQR